MSQVNKFKQEQNPDYIYFDLQQTNVQNTTEFIQQPLKFVETRDAPIVANSGEYHLSVTRFQLDTYNLPVLVVEPDLTQPTNTYNKNQTIYKVALLPVSSNITSQLFQVRVIELYSHNFSTTQSFFGEHIASTANKEQIGVVLGRPYGNGGLGSVEFYSQSTNQYISHTWTIANTTAIDMTEYIVGITEDERFIITDAFRTATSGAQTYDILVWDRDLGTTNPYVLSFNYANRGIPQISGDGKKIVKANYGANSISLYNFAGNTGTFTKFGNDITTAELVGGSVIGQNGLAMNYEGDTIVITNKAYNTNQGAVIMYNIDWDTANTSTAYPFVGAANDFLGHFVCLSGDGKVVAVSAVGSSAPYIRIYTRTTPGGVITWTLTQTLTGGEVELGDRLSLNEDGLVLFVATFATQRVKRFKKTSGVYTFEEKIAEYTTYNNVKANVVSNLSGNIAYALNWGDVNPGVVMKHQVLEMITINIGDKFELPSSIINVPIIKPVIWRSDYKDAVAPEKNVLTGKNTALYQYYYCNAYENFIARVNLAIREAYIAMIEDLYTNWVSVVNNASLTNVFVDYVVRQYAPAPFLEWNEAELKADIYATLLFQTNYVNEENTINYSSNPDITFSVVGNNRVGTPGRVAPFLFELAMNAPLYSLFNSFPATKKVLTAPTTNYRENYYIINFFTTGNDLITPSVPLHTPPTYPFVGSHYIVNSNIQYPSQYTENIAHANLLIKQPQELSTIDTWTPINAIVFTTTSLPIVVNQFSASSSIGEKPPSGSTSNEFAFIITDIQSNDQGFRPNVLYTPTAEFRRIDLTGNQPIRNIDISIFWRSTTGALIPMVLASGAQASIKLLFEKKDKTNQKEANASALSTSVRDIV